MTLQEFAALKPGDKVTNPMQGSSGEVTEISEAGVRVAWGGAHAVTFMYGVGSTAWMHWAKYFEPETPPDSVDPAGVRAENGT